MSMMYIDSCGDHYGTNDILRKWTTKGSTGVQITPLGRNGNAIDLASGNTSVNKTLPHRNEWFTGWAFFNTDTGSTPHGLYAGLNNGTSLVQLNLNADRTITLTTNFGNTVIANSVKNIQANVWYYIEVHYSFNGSTPVTVTAEVRVNTEVWGHGEASTNVNAVNLIDGMPTSNVHAYASGFIDDLYIFDTLGTYNKSYAGDIKIGVVMPNADTGVEQWDSDNQPGAGQFSCVNEIPPDNDATYISTNESNATSQYFYQPIAVFNGTIQGVQFMNLARKDDEGTIKVQPFSGATNGPIEYVSDGYEYFFQEFDADPTTGLPWTQSGFNATAFGVRLIP